MKQEKVTILVTITKANNQYLTTNYWFNFG